MELDENIKDIEFPYDEQRIQKNKEVVGELVLIFNDKIRNISFTHFVKHLAT
jgi:hypothetical protein